MASIADLRTSLNSRGLGGTAAWVAKGMLRVNSFLVLHQALTSHASSDERTADDVMMRRLTLAELRELRTRHRTLPTEFHCDETHGFTRPHVAFVHGQVAAIHWLVLPGEFSRFLVLQDGEAELNYNTVLPEYRGRRLAQRLMDHVMSRARDDGIRHMLGVVHSSNIPQYRPMLDMGFRPVEVVEHFLLSRPKAVRYSWRKAR